MNNVLSDEVREAFEYLDRFENCPSGWTIIRTELLWLADENKRMRGIIETLDIEGHRRAEKAEAELAEARETIKRLNRRVQVAEAGIAEKVKASAPGSLGRALANAAACKYEAELAAVRARIECADAGIVHRCAGCKATHVGASKDMIGKRILLLVDEPQDDNAKEGQR